MAGLSPVTATQEQTTALKVLARGPDRAGTDLARALLLTLKGWTGARIAQAFGVRQDRVRLWRSDCAPGRGLCPKGAYRAGALAGEGGGSGSRCPFCLRRWRTAGTGPCPAAQAGSRDAKALAFRARIARRCCAKRGVQRAEAPAQPKGPPMRGGG